MSRKTIKNFNFWILLGGIISFLIILSYGLTINTPPVWFFKNINIDKVNFFYGKIVDLSVGFIVSALFYLIVVYFPEKKKKEINIKVIKRYLYNVIDIMTQMINNLNKSFNNDDKEYHQLKDVDFSRISFNVDWNKEIGYYLNSNDILTKSNFIEYLSDQIQKVQSISSIILNYPGYFDDELNALIDNIRISRFHKRIKENSFFYLILKNNENDRKMINETLQLLSNDISEYCELVDSLRCLINNRNL